MAAFTLALAELRRWLRGPVIRPVALVTLALIPSLYGCVYLWSNWDPYGRLDRVPAAIVDEDRPVAASDGSTVAAGERLTRTLLKRQDLQWHTAGADRAKRGLEDGTYHLVLTVPRSFSADLLSPTTPKPRQARLAIGLNDANGFIIGKLAQSIETQLRAEVDSAAFTQYARAALTRQAQAEHRPATKEQIAVQAEAAGQPVRIDTANLNPVRVYGRGMAPFFFSIALWVFGLVVYEIVRPLDARALGSRVRPWSAAVGGWLPGALLGVVGALVLYGIAEGGLGLDARNVWGTLGLMALAAGAFAAVGQVVTALWGLAGAVVMLVLLMLQLTSCGGLYPVATTPEFFRVLHPAMPMTYLVEGLRVTLGGGQAWRAWRDAAVLAGVLVLFLGLGTAVAAVQRRWSANRLHDPLHG